MDPITFECRDRLPIPPERIAEQILDLAKWPEFEGFGILPGIASAEFEARTPEVVGTRIRVTNRDGSRHIEEITEWAPERGLQLRLHEFGPPLSRLATEFVETWEFGRVGGGTDVRRTFRMHARSPLTRPFVRLIAALMRRAVARHMRSIREELRLVDASPRSSAPSTRSDAG